MLSLLVSKDSMSVGTLHALTQAESMLPSHLTNGSVKGQKKRKVCLTKQSETDKPRLLLASISIKSLET